MVFFGLATLAAVMLNVSPVQSNEKQDGGGDFLLQYVCYIIGAFYDVP